MTPNPLSRTSDKTIGGIVVVETAREDGYVEFATAHDRHTLPEAMYDAIVRERRPPGVTPDDPDLAYARGLMCSSGGREYVEQVVLKPFGYRMKAELPPPATCEFCGRATCDGECVDGGL